MEHWAMPGGTLRGVAGALEAVDPFLGMGDGVKEGGACKEERVHWNGVHRFEY